MQMQLNTTIPRDQEYDIIPVRHIPSATGLPWPTLRIPSGQKVVANTTHVIFPRDFTAPTSIQKKLLITRTCKFCAKQQQTTMVIYALGSPLIVHQIFDHTQVCPNPFPKAERSIWRQLILSNDTKIK